MNPIVRVFFIYQLEGFLIKGGMKNIVYVAPSQDASDHQDYETCVGSAIPN